MAGFGDASGRRMDEQLRQEQERALVQAAVQRLTDIAFDKCLGTPSSSLSSREQDCIQRVAERYLETSVFVMNRLTKSAGGM